MWKDTYVIHLHAPLDPPLVCSRIQCRTKRRIPEQQVARANTLYRQIWLLSAMFVHSELTMSTSINIFLSYTLSSHIIAIITYIRIKQVKSNTLITETVEFNKKYTTDRHHRGRLTTNQLIWKSIASWRSTKNGETWLS